MLDHIGWHRQRERTKRAGGSTFILQATMINVRKNKKKKKHYNNCNCVCCDLSRIFHSADTNTILLSCFEINAFNIDNNYIFISTMYIKSIIIKKFIMQNFQRL